jgi:hypothetical protein
MAAPQTYATHAHRPLMSGAAGLLAGIAFGLLFIDLLREPDRRTVELVLLTVAVLLLVSISRTYIVRLQDRIIMLEMRVRLARLGLENQYERLTKRQLIALRFASDAEIRTLIERAIAEKMTGTQIKQAIRDWQPDYHRT